MEQNVKIVVSSDQKRKVSLIIYPSFMIILIISTVILDKSDL